METVEMNMCLSKFYTTARRNDGSYYKKSSLMSIRAALDRHLQSPPPNKNFSICDPVTFQEVNKTAFIPETSHCNWKNCRNSSQKPVNS